jgi:hypothetical protein
MAARLARHELNQEDPVKEESNDIVRGAVNLLRDGIDPERVLRFVYQHGFMAGGLAVMREVVEPLTIRIEEEA